MYVGFLTKNITRKFVPIKINKISQVACRNVCGLYCNKYSVSTVQN